MDDEEYQLDPTEDVEEEMLVSTPGLVTAVASGKKKRRRGDVFHCKHGCGYIYVRKAGQKNDRSARDAYDYHETQGCELLPRLLCPLGCHRKGKLVSFGGIKALRNHYKSKTHLEAMAMQGVTRMEKLSSVDGPPASVPRLAADEETIKHRQKKRRRAQRKAMKAVKAARGTSSEDDSGAGDSRERKRAKRERKRERRRLRALKNLDKINVSHEEEKRLSSIFECMYEFSLELEENKSIVRIPDKSVAQVAPGTAKAVPQGAPSPIASFPVQIQ